MMRAVKDTAKNIFRSFGLDVARHYPHFEAGEVERLNFPLFLDWVLARSTEFKFVQIGANDGRMHDPLYELIRKYKPSGVLVEPQANLFERLKENYKDQPQLAFEKAVIAAEEGEVTFYSLSDALDRPEENFNFSGMASLDREHVIRGFNRFAPRFGIQGKAEDYLVEMRVPAMSFATLLHKHNLTKLDLLQIDAEGYDYEILKTIDFKMIKPALICYEHSSLSPADKKASWDLLKSHGYRVAASVVDTFGFLVETVK